MSAVVDKFTFWSARQVEVAHEHLLRIAIAVWRTLILAGSRIVGLLIMGTWSTAQMGAAVLVIAVTPIRIAHVMGRIVDGS